MRKAALTILATLILAIMMTVSAGSALAGWGWEDTNSSPSSPVVTPGPDNPDKKDGAPTPKKRDLPGVGNSRK